jgi:hypothetical protein
MFHIDISPQLNMVVSAQDAPGIDDGIVRMVFVVVVFDSLGYNTAIGCAAW